MEEYIVSARKYRPASFDTVVGQGALTTTLKNAISSGKLAHAYLFCGPRGVGKTTCARIFAKTINCLTPTADGEACNQCESCVAFNEQRSYNIHELDAASNNSVDDIRQLVEQVRIPPQIGKYKVYIIDEVHMLSASAFNAFLKTLEEPPLHAIFILATTEKHKILPTILSRCQIYDFNRISIEDTVAHLAKVAANEGIQAEPEALNIIALKADGGMRDALSIFDQVSSFTNGNITYKGVIENLNVLDYDYYFRLTDFFLSNNVSESLLLFNEVLNKGFDGNHFITGLASHFRDLLVSKDKATLPLLQVGSSIRDKYYQQAQKCPQKFLYKAMKLCNTCDLNYRASKNKRLLVELTLIQIAQITGDTEDESSGRSPKSIIKPIAKNAAAPEKAKSEQKSNTKQEAAAQSSIKKSATPARQHEHRLEIKQQDKAVPTLKSGTIGISIKQTMNEVLQEKDKKEEEKVQQVQEETEGEDFIVNERDINFYWKEYANKLPVEQTALAKRMLMMHLQLIEKETFLATVENELVEKEFHEAGDSIEKYLRKRLKNRKLKMQIKVSDEKPQNRPVGRAEIYQMMVEKNRELQSLKEKLKLELY